MIEVNEQKILLRRLQQAYEEDNLTLFVGAGVSKTVPNSQAKLWCDLVKEMQDILASNETDPLRLAQMLFQQYPQKYYELAKNSIDSSENISAIHDMIARLAPRTVITTNWDCLLEKALDKPPYAPYDTITCDEELLQSQREHKLIKMHGDFARGDGRFVFKEDDYLTYSYNYPLIETFVKSILTTTNVLFIGYSYSDINLKMIMTWLKNNRKQNGVPIHVITQDKEDDIQKRYFLNWGIETYLCNDTTSPELSQEEHGLSDDELHHSYRLYNFLNQIYQVDSTNIQDADSLWDAYVPFSSLPALPFSLITHLLPKAKLKCDYEGTPFLNLDVIPEVKNISQQQTPENVFNEILFDQLTEYTNAKQSDDEKKLKDLPDSIEKIVSFWKKAGICEISLYNLSQISSPKVLSLNDVDEKSSYYCCDDVSSYLDFSKNVFDELYNVESHQKRVSALFKNRKYAECLIENQSLYILEKLKRLSGIGCVVPQSAPEFYIRDAAEFVDVLTPRLKKRYKILVNILTLKDINDKSRDLSRKIYVKLDFLNQRKMQGKISFDISNSFTERIELLNYLRFFWLNNLCEDYYIEFKEYVFLSLKYFFCLCFYSRLCCLMEQSEYDNALSDSPAVPLMRFELSAFIRYVDEKHTEELLNPRTYFLNGPLKLELQSEDIDWMIKKVLPNLAIQAQKKITPLDGTVWKQRVGQVFRLLSIAGKIEPDLLKTLFDFIKNEDFILNEPFLVLPQIVYFCSVRKDDLQFINTLEPDFLESFVSKAIGFLKEGFSRQNPYSVQSLDEVFKIANCFDPKLVTISNDLTDNFLTCYFSEHENWCVRCRCIHGLSWFYNVADDSKKKKIKDSIDECLSKEKASEIMYVIFRVYLVLLGMHPLTLEFLNEIAANEALPPQASHWDSNIDWLVSLLRQLDLTTEDSELKKQLNATIRLFCSQK